MTYRLDLTAHQRMALLDLIADYMRKPDHLEIFIDCSQAEAPEIETGELLSLVMNASPSRPIIRTKPIHTGLLMNCGRGVDLEVNGHSYRLWYDIHEYEKLEEKAQAVASDLGAEYISEPWWKAP